MHIVTKTGLVLMLGGGLYLLGFSNGKSFAMDASQGNIQAAARKLVRDAGDKVMTERFLQNKFDEQFNKIVEAEK